MTQLLIQTELTLNLFDDMKRYSISAKIPFWEDAPALFHFPLNALHYLRRFY